MDATKAFDRINHWTLFNKLIERGVPVTIVRMLCYWYRSQHSYVRWGSHVCDSFYILNGVRQGDILSPLLFNLYVDGLSFGLNSFNIGGKIGPRLVNHLAYADDLVLICPSLKGLQRLVYVCQEYMVIVTLLHIIATQTVCM